MRPLTPIYPATRDAERRTPRARCSRLLDPVMVSNQPRPKSISAELRDYYLKQANGRELLEGVEVVPGAEEVSGPCLDGGC